MSMRRSERIGGYVVIVVTVGHQCPLNLLKKPTFESLTELIKESSGSKLEDYRRF
jgi:hypothetical protein